MGGAAALILALFSLASSLVPETISFASPVAASVRANADALTASPGNFPVLQDTTRRRPTGTMSRRARALEKKSQSVDTADVTKSAARILEAIKALPRDSSARLAFQYVRRDEQVVNLLSRPTHALYLPDPMIIRTQQTLDSTKLEYRVRRLYGTMDTRIPLTFTLDEYRELRLRQTIRKNWEAKAHAYELEMDKKKGLGDLFGSVTNIEIPVPKNPIFSIFGPNIIRIQINGAVDIHGAFRNTASDLFLNNPLAQSRSEPDFSQEVQVNVKGQIGDKLTLDADWNTQRQFEYENQLKVHYKGYDDDIIQSVEAGNVSLTTNSSFISSSSALFGIKAGFQIGPLKLTTVASQKKGQIKALSVSGGGKPTPFERRATDYSTDYYFIDTSYIAWFDSAYINIPPVVNLRKEIRDLEVWVTRIGNEDPNERDVVAFMDQNQVLAKQGDPAARRQEYDMVPGEVEVGRFIRLDPNSDYTYHQYAGYITLNRSLQAEQAIAVAYALPDPTSPQKSVPVGNFGSRDTAKTSKLVMKLVRPQKLGPQYKTAWRMMMKNVYPLGGRGIKKEGFELKLLYEVPGKEPQDNILGLFNLLEVFGLDRYGEQPGSPPDGKFDYAPLLTINESRGELIFPRAEPFLDGVRKFFLSKGLSTAQADSFAFREVYDTTFNGASNSQRNKFLIRGSTSSSMASTYQIGFNTVEGSVKVVVNGNQAVLNTDYSVDYISGQVTIKNQALLVPGANLQIQYEANDLLQLASKSLLGARGELNLGKNSSLGFTVMNLSQQSLSDKIRLGEEPISNTILGLDGGTTFDLDFLTRAVNWLPGVQTNALSNISIKGEAAYMSPNPNTRTSPISTDHGASVAYIDDFEGSRKTIPLATQYGAWRDASVPEFISTLDNPLKLTSQAKMEYKAKLVWYTVQPSDVSATQIWPNKSVRAGQDQVTVLNLWYRPNERAAYNYSMDLDTKLRANHQKTWAGIQRLLGSTATNLLDENINFIELWVHLNKVQSTVKLNIDLGLISEDVIPNNRLDTEDGLDGGIKNGILRPGEDVGIDGLSNEQEKIQYHDFITKYPEYADDPSGDDWVRPNPQSLDPNEYRGINGTENNAQSDVGRFPDSEDLNRNNNVDRTNSYFEYELSLDTLSNDFRQFVTGGNNGWYQVRIPLNGFKRTIGEPSFGTVEAMRVWLTGAQDETLIRIAEFNLVGNQWEELVKNDSTFRVSVVNIEDNPNYVSPSSLPRQRDPNQPDQIILLNEQSLNLIVNGLKDGESRQSIKRFPTRPLDLFSYRAMQMFVHGDERPGTRIHYNDTTNYDLELFLRFGSDSLNYYEYRAPIQAGWDLNDVNISFAEITAIKQFGRDSLTTLSPRIPVSGGPPGATYQVRGLPTLTNIRQIVVGVQNPSFKGPSVVTTEVWVNELRLTDVDNTPGWAYRFDTSVKIADIANVTFNMTQRDANFHSLEDRFGTRNQDRNWAIAASVAFERFLPQSWAGTGLSFSYSRSEQLQNPKYMPGTDILVDQASQVVADAERAKGTPDAIVLGKADSVRLRTQTLNVSETFALPNIRLNVPVNSWLVTETINKLSLSYSFTRSSQRSPVTESLEQWLWNAKATYGLTFSDRNFISPFAPFGDFFLTKSWKDLKIYFSPRNFNVSASFARGQTKEQARDQTIAKPTVRNFTAGRSMSFAWQFTDGGLLNLGTEYALDIQSTLLNFETDEFGRQRSFSQIMSEMFGKSKLIDFGNDLNYGQSININPRILIPPILMLDRIFSVSTRYSARYDWVNNLQAGSLGKGAGASGNASLNFDVNMKTIGEQIWSQQQGAPEAATDTGKGKSAFNLAKTLDRASRILFKTPIFDFEKLSMTFTQQTRTQNSGVIGRPGFANMFGRIPFVESSLPENGPSLMYQLGLSSDPHGEVIVKGTNKFPFIGGYTLPGIRAPNGNLVDQYSQANNLTMRTNRPLWEGASIELNWNLNWNYNVNKTIQSDSLGFTTVNSKVVSGDVSRSYLSFPSILFFKFLNTSIEQVQKQYVLARDNKSDVRSSDAKISEAFEKGLEALPFAQKFLGNLMPRPNWTIRWDGLEKLPLFNLITTRIAFDHSYTSGYKMRWRIDPTGNQITESQAVSYGFAPLVGFNVTFKQILKGNFTANFRYGTSTNYDLTPAAQNIVQSDITDMTITGGFSRSGFEIPFFGLALSNDIEVSFSYSNSKNARRVYDLNSDNFKPEGTPLEGSSRTILEPRIRYILSARVTASVYYKYTKLKPDEGGSRIPGSTTNEGGLDVRIAIQP